MSGAPWTEGLLLCQGRTGGASPSIPSTECPCGAGCWWNLLGTLDAASPQACLDFPVQGLSQMALKMQGASLSVTWLRSLWNSGLFCLCGPSIKVNHCHTKCCLGLTLPGPRCSEMHEFWTVQVSTSPSCFRRPQDPGNCLHQGCRPKLNTYPMASLGWALGP